MGFRKFGFGGEDRPKPVKEGEELDVTIIAVAAKGDGIAKKDGFVIFVAGASEGENIRIRVKEVRSRCAVAEKVGEATGQPAPAAAPAAEEEAAAPEEEAGEPEEETSA